MAGFEGRRSNEMEASNKSEGSRRTSNYMIPSVLPPMVYGAQPWMYGQPMVWQSSPFMPPIFSGQSLITGACMPIQTMAPPLEPLFLSSHGPSMESKGETSSCDGEQRKSSCCNGEQRKASCDVEQRKENSDGEQRKSAHVFHVQEDASGNVQLECGNDVVRTPTKEKQKIPEVELIAEPCDGMEFECIDDVRKFYNNYAKKEGFGIASWDSTFVNGVG
ncbi:hypothetical protein Taro_050193 [Colocasia esculenta]|uniref:Uncharacterized protein n=1 Tax=Colocasia esculenta TaxID=4460 RepID=A0A843XD50_COLES|nr:hypothetical protein [Colocasia esculenta]